MNCGTLLWHRRDNLTAWVNKLKHGSQQNSNFVTCSLLKLCPIFCDRGLLHARFPHPSLSPGVCSNSYPLSQRCHPTSPSSVDPFSWPQSFPASGSFPTSQLFASRGQSNIEVNSVSDEVSTVKLKPKQFIHSFLHSIIFYWGAFFFLSFFLIFFFFVSVSFLW